MDGVIEKGTPDRPEPEASLGSAVREALNCNGLLGDFILGKSRAGALSIWLRSAAKFVCG
jgi:hypothetical protein